MLVIKVNMIIEHKVFQEVKSNILEQFKAGTGVVMLPFYCEPIVVPDDVEIKFEDGDGREIK